MEYIAGFLLLVIMVLGTMVLCSAKKPAAKPPEPVRTVREYPNGKFAALLDGYKLVRLNATGEVLHLRGGRFPPPPYRWLFETFNEAMDLHRQHMAGDQYSDQRVRFTGD